MVALAVGVVFCCAVLCVHQGMHYGAGMQCHYDIQGMLQLATASPSPSSSPMACSSGGFVSGVVVAAGEDTGNTIGNAAGNPIKRARKDTPPLETT